jgi:hypothetical protein
MSTTVTARDRLSRAQEDRRARVESLTDTVDERLSLVFDVENLGVENVSPADLKKLSPILRSLAKDRHPFTKCMRNLRDEQPTWSEDRRKRTCNVLKQLIGRKQGKQSLSLSSDLDCSAIDDKMVALLECADDEVLAIIATADETGERLAVMSAKQRKNLPPASFVFAKDKRYPIHDLAHAKNALARASGKPEEAAVKAAVYRKFPQLRPKDKAS